MNFKVGQRVWNIKKKRFDIIKITSEQSSILENGEHLFNVNLHQTADDMFKALGYKDTSWETKGWYLIEKDFGKYIEEIRIDLLTGDYKKSKVFSKDKMMWSGTLTKEEHQAIHQKLIELGWIE